MIAGFPCWRAERPAKDWSFELRKIIHRCADHNPDRLRPLVVGLAVGALLGLSVLAVCGCSRQTEHSAAQETAKTAETATRTCPVVCDSGPWTAFRSLADRLAAGMDVPRPELAAYTQLPQVGAWCRSLETSAPTASNVANWLEGAWWAEQGHQGDQKANRMRASMGALFRYAQTRGERIDSLVAEFVGGGRDCMMYELAEFWLDPDTIPSPLVLVFLPGSDEIRLFEGKVYVDAGVLAAGGSDQTARQVASLLYRSLAATPGTNPIEATGEQAVGQCLRVLKNEGIAGWIEQITAVAFDADHPTLSRVHIVPEDFYRKAQRTITGFSERLPAMLEDPAVMAQEGQSFARSLAASNAFTQTGIAMADVIASRLGVERLRAVRDSVPGFLAAYQEAALANARPLPEPGTAGISLYESVPALEPETFELLYALTLREWPSP
jgi:hypothetical protein